MPRCLACYMELTDANNCRRLLKHIFTEVGRYDSEYGETTEFVFFDTVYTKVDLNSESSMTLICCFFELM